MKKIKLLCAAGLLGALAMTSCTDLTEKVYSDLVRDNYYTDKLSVEAAVVRCFEHSDNVTWRGDIWKLQELTGDHFVWTQKGRHGYDVANGFACTNINGTIFKDRSTVLGWHLTSVSVR